MAESAFDQIINSVFDRFSYNHHQLLDPRAARQAAIEQWKKLRFVITPPREKTPRISKLMVLLGDRIKFAHAVRNVPLPLDAERGPAVNAFVSLPTDAFTNLNPFSNTMEIAHRWARNNKPADGREEPTILETLRAYFSGAGYSVAPDGFKEWKGRQIETIEHFVGNIRKFIDSRIPERSKAIFNKDPRVENIIDISITHSANVIAAKNIFNLESEKGLSALKVYPVDFLGFVAKSTQVISQKMVEARKKFAFGTILKEKKKTPTIATPESNVVSLHGKNGAETADLHTLNTQKDSPAPQKEVTVPGKAFTVPTLAEAGKKRRRNGDGDNNDLIAAGGILSAFAAAGLAMLATSDKAPNTPSMEPVSYGAIDPQMPIVANDETQVQKPPQANTSLESVVASVDNIAYSAKAKKGDSLIELLREAVLQAKNSATADQLSPEVLKAFNTILPGFDGSSANVLADTSVMVGLQLYGANKDKQPVVSPGATLTLGSAFGVNYYAPNSTTPISIIDAKGAFNPNAVAQINKSHAEFSQSK
jgi:hypothetical protein